MEEMTYLIFCFFIVWYRSFSQSFSIFFQKCFYYVDLFPSPTGRLLVLIDFFRSPCLLRFSPGIVCCLFRNVFWFKKFFIHFQNRILLTHYISAQIKVFEKHRIVANCWTEYFSVWFGYYFHTIVVTINSTSMILN